MASSEIQIAGFGGQGVILAGMVIGRAASIYDGRFATLTQSFGPEARGSACSAQLIVADEPILYPYITQPDILVVMSQEAHARFAPGLKPGGLLLYEQDLIQLPPAEHPTPPATRREAEPATHPPALSTPPRPDSETEAHRPATPGEAEPTVHRYGVSAVAEEAQSTVHRDGVSAVAGEAQGAVHRDGVPAVAGEAQGAVHRDGVSAVAGEAQGAVHRDGVSAVAGEAPAEARRYGIPATRLAEELGRKLVLNMVMVGFVTALTGLATPAAVRQAIAASVPKGTENLNLAAFEKGLAFGQSKLAAPPRRLISP